MAGDWIKVECVTPDKPEVFQIAEQLEIEPEHAFGSLVIIWIWADLQTVDGNAGGNGVSVTKTLLNRKAGVKGFADAMLKVGWLVEKDGALCLPNFEKHNGNSAKSRAQTARRVAKHKASGKGNASGNAKGNVVSVTNALPREEKRREDIKENNKKKISIPVGFAISDRVRTWAKEKGFNNLDAHLENFILQCQSKNYKYADWDSALMNAIRSDWAKINSTAEQSQPRRSFPV